MSVYKESWEDEVNRQAMLDDSYYVDEIKRLQRSNRYLRTIIKQMHDTVIEFLLGDRDRESFINRMEKIQDNLKCRDDKPKR